MHFVYMMSLLPKPCRVLVIDDNPDSAELMQILLQMEGFVVQIALTGAAGLSKLRTFLPQVVCLDIEIYDVPVRDLVRQIKSCVDLQTPLLIGMTGWDDAHLSDLSIKDEFDTVYLKPVPIEEFLAETRRFCHK